MEYSGLSTSAYIYINLYALGTEKVMSLNLLSTLVQLNVKTELNQMLLKLKNLPITTTRKAK